MTTGEVAAILGKSARQIRNMVEREQLPALRRIPGVGHRFLCADISAWLAAVTARTTAAEAEVVAAALEQLAQQNPKPAHDYLAARLTTLRRPS